MNLSSSGHTHRRHGHHQSSSPRVRTHVRVYKANDLGRNLLWDLLQLTNSPHRGDLRDDGTEAGSNFRSDILDRLEGRPFCEDTWALLAYDGDGVLIAWAMLRRHDRLLRTGAVNFYVSPDVRRTGVGAALDARLVLHAELSGISTLHARPWNAKSRAFFVRLGYSLQTPGFADKQL